MTRTARREFSRNQREQIIERSKRDGVICCEKCGLVLAGKPFEIDHIIAEGLRPEADKKVKITIAEGQLLGNCCHRGEDGKTGKDQTTIAKAKRQYDKKHGATKPSSKLSAAPKQPKESRHPPLRPRALFREVTTP